MNANDDLQQRIASLADADLALVRDYVSFLEWRRGGGRGEPAAAAARWTAGA